MEIMYIERELQVLKQIQTAGKQKRPLPFGSEYPPSMGHIGSALWMMTISM